MSSLSKIALGVALAGLISAFVGPAKLVIGGLIVAAGSWAWAKYVAPRLA